MKKFSKEKLYMLIALWIALHPILELDYLFGDFFDSIGLPRITTLIDFVIMPLLVILVFWLYEENKKKVLIFSIIYGVVFGIYFIFHCKVGRSMEANAHMGYTAYFSVFQEIVYIVTMMLPLVYIYVLNKIELKEVIVQKITSVISFTVSLPIVLSNLLKVGYNTYGVEVAGTIIDWFSMPFNSDSNHPRAYATKFFFEEGNTIGILLLMVLPFMYYFFHKEKGKKKLFYVAMIITDSLAMLMLGTRVGTYGTVIVPVMMLCIHIFTVLVKTDKFNKLLVIACVLLTLLNAFIIPYSPAYQNQQYDAEDYSTLKLDDSIREGYRLGIAEGAEGFEPFSKEWIDYYAYMFTNYQFLIGVTPKVYYTYFYDYRVDPKFWVDLIFNYELEERINARQIEKIFVRYKWDEFMSSTDHLTGTTYALFMQGGINIEQDFIQQFYSFGYLGFPLVMGPWIILFVYLVIRMLLGYKEGKWNLYNIMLFGVIGLGTVGAITSGHVYDELSTSLVIALCIAILLQNLRRKKNA